jgi:hypothetical protein
MLPLHLKRLIHYLTSKNRHGFGVHSPYLYRFITGVVENPYPFYCFNELETLITQQTKADPASYPFPTFSSKLPANHTQKINELLFRIIQWEKPSYLIQVGYDFDFDTCYLLKAAPGVPFHFFLPDKTPLNSLLPLLHENSDTSQRFQTYPIPPEEAASLFAPFQEIPFCLMDVSLSTQLIPLAEACLKKAGNQALLAVKGIHQTHQLEESWNRLKKHHRVTASMDLFHLGILFLRPDLEKRTYKLTL